MPDNKTLVRFNVQNIKYATPTSDGNFNTPVEYGTAIKMALQSDSSVKKIFGDGRRICAIVNEKGKTGTMTTNNVSDDYEIAMGRKLKTKNGLAEVKQTKCIVHAIYFETCGLEEDGSMPIAKTWLYGVTSSRPSESFDQTTDDINESSFDTALEMAGVPLKKEDGTVCKDEKGNDIIVWQMTVTPDDEGYETFGDSVVLPILPETTA
ncbi:MAG: hypothetical protein IJ301_06015 [Clostridia bacterium]|nr:hypothetical protein [Clostridia bacterium]